MEKRFGTVAGVQLLAASLIIAAMGMYALYKAKQAQHEAAMAWRATIPAPPKLEFSPYRTAPIEVARIFGRSQGCSEASPEFIDLVATEAVRTGVDPRLFAATVAVESGCNKFAVSARGAVGYTQVVPRVWKAQYDFSGQYNLFNERDNLHVGASILSSLVRQHGVQAGIRRYNGLGEGCATCDAGYTAKILLLANKR